MSDFNNFPIDDNFGGAPAPAPAARPAVERVQNQFAVQSASDIHMPQSYGASNSVDQARAIAEVQVSMVLAHQNPRDPVVAMDRILNACTRQKLAESALYVYARGGQNISGASIRLAEALAQNWGNIQYGLREISSKNGVSEMQAYAWDLETNVKREITFPVAHKRFTRKGAYDLTDPRDIYELTANQGARRLRTCILAVIPGDVTETAVRQCQLTMQANVDCSPEKIKALLNAFADFGVTKSMIEARIQRRIEGIAPAQVVTLRNIYASLKDGMGTAADYFDLSAAGAPADASKGADTPAALGAADGNANALLNAINKASAAAEPVAPTEPRQRASKNTRANFERIADQIADIANGAAGDPVALDNEINASELTAEERAELGKKLADAIASLS